MNEQMNRQADIMLKIFVSHVEIPNPRSSEKKNTKKNLICEI